MHTRKAITEALQKLGVQTGDLLMVHASLKAIGPVEGGAETVVAALRSAVGPTGTVMGYASWDRSPYEETLNGAGPRGNRIHCSDAEGGAGKLIFKATDESPFFCL